MDLWNDFCSFLFVSDQLWRSDLYLKDALWREISRLPTIYSVSDENKHERCSQRHWGGKCVCVCVCACLFCIVVLEPLSTLGVSFFFFIADNISIAMYIMCIILCLFSVLSCRVGSLQISIIIIKHAHFCWKNIFLKKQTGRKCS